MLPMLKIMDSKILKWFYFQLGDPAYIIDNFLYQDYWKEHRKKFCWISSYDNCYWECFDNQWYARVKNGVGRDSIIIGWLNHSSTN